MVARYNLKCITIYNGVRLRNTAVRHANQTERVTRITGPNMRSRPNTHTNEARGKKNGRYVYTFLYSWCCAVFYQGGKVSELALTAGGGKTLCTSGILLFRVQSNRIFMT